MWLARKSQEKGQEIYINNKETRKVWVMNSEGVVGMWFSYVHGYWEHRQLNHLITMIKA